LTEPGFSVDLELTAAPGTPNVVTPKNILALQRSVGNQAVQRMLQRQRSGAGPAPGTIQRDDTVAAPPAVGAYATGRAPRINAPVAPAEDVSPEQARFDAAYNKVLGGRANLAIIESLLGPAIQGVVVPELSKNIMVKTRKDLTAAIKGDAHLYEGLGADDAAREAALAGIMQQVAAQVVGRLPEFQPMLAEIKDTLKKRINSLPGPELDANVVRNIGGLRATKLWVTGLGLLEQLEQKQIAYYSTEVTRETKTYMESNGEGIVDSMNAYLEEHRKVKERLRAQFNRGVDASLGVEDVPAAPPPPFSEAPPAPMGGGEGPAPMPPAPPPAYNPDAPAPSGPAYATQAPGPKYRKTNFNEDTGQDYSEYIATGAGVASAGGGGATKFSQLVSPIVSSSSAAAESVNVFGAGGGIAGVASGAMETVRGIQDMSNSSAATGDRVVGGGGRTASGVASMVQQGGSAAYNIASITQGATSSAALTATAVAGGGAVAMGAVDMARGAYGAYKGHQRQQNLNNIASSEDAGGGVKSAAMQAASTQEMRKKVAGATVLKGALLVAGGVTLLVLATNPVGWILLGAGALVGGLAALWRFWQKRKRKKEVAIRELGVEEDFKKYEQKKKDANAGWSPLKYKERQAAVAAVKAENPLHKKMLAMSYKKNDYAKFYADYIHDTAQILYMNGVVLGKSAGAMYRQMRQIVENMGLEVNPDAGTPTPEQIGKALNT
jgi:hypothetical protein